MGKEGKKKLKGNRPNKSENCGRRHCRWMKEGVKAKEEIRENGLWW